MVVVFNTRKPLVKIQPQPKKSPSILKEERSLKALRDRNKELERALGYYADCYDQRDNPSILRQTNWPCGIFEFPNPLPESWEFNCSLARINGDLRLFTRRNKATTYHKQTANDIVSYSVAEDMTLSDPLPIELKPRIQGEQFEDPRVIVHGDYIYLSACTWLHDKPCIAHQIVAMLDSELSVVAVRDPVFGHNMADQLQQSGNEKNWCWFVHDEAFYCVYSMEPHLVFRYGEEGVEEEHITDSMNHLWRHGHPRGGTPPVRVGNEYLAFFHSSLPWKLWKRRYFMGAYAFEAKPPFRITRMSSIPILSGSTEDPHTRDGAAVVFPSGAVFEKNEWLVTFGINDEASGWIKIPHSELLPTLRPL